MRTTESLSWTRVELSDLPQNLMRPHDLIGAILSVVDRLAVGQFEDGEGRRHIDSRHLLCAENLSV